MYPCDLIFTFFYEKLQPLHIIAAGSLLEFALAEIPSFGVGRVRSIFVFPMSFDEYLMAIGEDALLDEKLKSSLERPLLLPFHEKLLREVKNFLIMGGMPEVVAKYVETKDIKRCGPVLDDLIISLKSDFAKI